MSGSANGYLSISCMVAVAVELLDDMRDEAVDVVLGVLLIEVLDPSVSESRVFEACESVSLVEVSSSSSSSSSFSRFSANFPMLSKTVCVFVISVVSSSRSPITLSKAPLRHPRSSKRSKMLAPCRHASSYDGGGPGGCMSSSSLRILSSIPLIFETKDTLGPLSLMIAERVFASSVMLKIAPTSSITCELATDPVGFKEMVGIARVGPVVMVLGCPPGTNMADGDGVPVECIDCRSEDTLEDIFEAPATTYKPELLLL